MGDGGGLVFVPKAGHGSNAQIKKPTRLRVGFFIWAPGGDLLSRGQSALSSALSRFTVLFGMGRRGSNSLWPPSKLKGGRPRSVYAPHWAYGFNNLEEVLLGLNQQHNA